MQNIILTKQKKSVINKYAKEKLQTSIQCQRNQRVVSKTIVIMSDFKLLMYVNTERLKMYMIVKAESRSESQRAKRI